MKHFKNLMLVSLVAAMGASLATPALAAATPDPAHLWDEMWAEVLTDLITIGVVFGLADLYFMLRYKASSPGQKGQAARLTGGQALAFALVPACVFVADDFFLAGKGLALFNVQRTVPDNAMEVKVIGHQWYYDFDYGNGVTTNELKVPVGKPVVLRMTADDVNHGFYMPEYRIKEDVQPGRITYLWFNPVKPTETFVTCTQYCGTAHSNMSTKVSAVPAEQFTSWLETQTKQARANTADKKI